MSKLLIQWPKRSGRFLFHSFLSLIQTNAHISEYDNCHRMILYYIYPEIKVLVPIRSTDIGSSCLASEWAREHHTCMKRASHTTTLMYDRSSSCNGRMYDSSYTVKDDLKVIEYPLHMSSTNHWVKKIQGPLVSSNSSRCRHRCAAPARSRFRHRPSLSHLLRFGSHSQCLQTTSSSG